MTRLTAPWVHPLMMWLLLVWAAVAVGGAIAGAVWGLTGFDCGLPGRPDLEGTCPVAQNPTLSQLASQAVGGAIRLGVAAVSIGFVPASIFAVSATVLGWSLTRLGSDRSTLWAPQMTLIAGTSASLAALIHAELAVTYWAWAGLIVVVGLVAIGINELADNLRPQFLEPFRSSNEVGTDAGNWKQ